MSVAVGGILAAAGQGRRFGGERAKTLAPLCGKPLFIWALAPLVQVCEKVVVAAPESDQQAFSDAINHAGLIGKVSVSVGAAQRWQSVRGALELLGEATMVIVHDGARPFATVELCQEVLDAARDFGAAVCGVRIGGAVKEVDAEGRIVRSPSTERLRLSQTPQAFYGALLKDSLDALASGNLLHAGVEDDAAIVAAAGGLVQVVSGAPANRLISTREDLRWAEHCAVQAQAAP